MKRETPTAELFNLKFEIQQPITTNKNQLMKLIIPDTDKKEFRALLVSGGEAAKAAEITQRGPVSPERMTQAALAAIRRTPELLQCRVDSLLEALTLCMQAGLEPDGRNAHLLAQGDRVRVLFDWKGLVALGRRSGVEAIHADVVCGRDEFGVSYDGGVKLVHNVDYKSPRGEAYAAYCYYIIEGEPDVEVMTREEVERTREIEIAAAPDYPALAGFWERDWSAMARRVVVARAALRWPVDMPAAVGTLSTPAPAKKAADSGHATQNNNGTQDKDVTQSPPKALDTLRRFMQARSISEASMLDYLKEEGRIADFVTRIADVPEPVIEDVVSSWVGMMEEE